MKDGIHKTPAGWFRVVVDGKEITCERTHREAWRVFDRIMGDPVSRSDTVADWLWKKGLET